MCALFCCRLSSKFLELKVSTNAGSKSFILFLVWLVRVSHVSFEVWSLSISLLNAHNQIHPAAAVQLVATKYSNWETRVFLWIALAALQFQFQLHNRFSSENAKNAQTHHLKQCIFNDILCVSNETFIIMIVKWMKRFLLSYCLFSLRN